MQYSYSMNTTRLLAELKATIERQNFVLNRQADVLRKQTENHSTATRGEEMIRVYHLEHINNGTRITAYPDTHAHCLTMRSKQQTPANWKLVEAGRTGSFIVCSRKTGNAVVEIWEESTRDAVDNSRFEVVPIMQYLQELNSK